MSSNRAVGGDPSPRWKYGLWAVFAGLAAICIVAVVGVLRYSEPSDAAAAIAPVVAAISALTGAYFGVQVGSAGKEQADVARDSAHREAVKFAAIADPWMAQQVLGMSPRSDDTTPPPSAPESSDASTATGLTPPGR
jgi:hypothetical protein